MPDPWANTTHLAHIYGTYNNESKGCPLEPERYHVIVLPWLYLTLAILGFLANGLAFLDLWHSEWSPTVIFTLNLVVSDLMVCCSFPFWTAFYSNATKWLTDTVICSITMFVTVSFFYINLYCNMCFLLWTSINRYATVVQPRWAIFQAFRRPPFCKCICVVTWVIGIITICIPVGYKTSVSSTDQAHNTCFHHVVNTRIEQLNTLHGAGIGMFFFILGLMLVSYGLLIFHLQKVRGGSMVGAGFGPGGGLKVRRKILASVILFVACFLPYHVQRIRIILSEDRRDCDKQQQNMNIKNLTILVAALSSCLHPALHLTMRLPCCRVKRNTRTSPKPEITRSQVTPQIHATELTFNGKLE
ncbi:probable G-protein coupled receptor 82 [Hoplias malabaricus]|uniref:probable G-protein coupled receptor 82 n=1 Tax=Hoplias malabaricus TaxID=27720 RepID=UPI0034622D33